MHLSAVTIRNVRAAPHEVQSISVAGNALKPQIDTAGSVVRLNEIMNATGHYVPDALHDLRFALAWWSSADGGNDTDLVALRAKKGGLGTLNMDATIARWAREGTSSLVDIVAASQSNTDPYAFVCNLDSMHHIHKGVVGLLIQAGDGVSADADLVIEKVTNDGRMGGHAHPEVCAPTYRHHSPAGKAAGHVGYTGCQSRGIGVVASQNIDFERVTVKDVRSAQCDVKGLHLFNDVHNVTVRAGTLAGCVAGYAQAESDTMPVGGFPKLVPVDIDHPTEMVRVNLTKV